MDSKKALLQTNRKSKYVKGGDHMLVMNSTITYPSEVQKQQDEQKHYDFLKEGSGESWYSEDSLKKYVDTFLDENGKHK